MSVHADNLPSLEEFAALLFSRPDGEAGKLKRRMLIAYAGLWAAAVGVPTWQAIETACELADDAQATADERHAEASR